MSVWKSAKNEKICLNDIASILKKVALNKEHKVIVGTDSVRLGDNFVFASAICILNKNFYDRKYFYTKHKSDNPSYADLSVRLLKETKDSLDIAFELTNLVSDVNIEIHADVNPEDSHMSSRYLGMVSGYILGCGFDVKVKPESYVASAVADFHTRKS